MTNPELDKTNDGCVLPWLLINKETGKEMFDSGFILDPIKGFEDFNLNDLKCTHLE